MSDTNYFARYYPPTPENLQTLEYDIYLSTQLRLPTNLERIVSGLTVIVNWCYEQAPARRAESQIYESVIINANQRIAQIRAELELSGLFYPDATF